MDPGEYIFNISMMGFTPHLETVALVNKDKELSIQLTEDSRLIEEVTVDAIRAGTKTPTTHSEIYQEEIEENNFGQDLPYLLNTIP